MSDFAAEARKLIVGQRNADYGHPAQDFAKTAKLWSGLLLTKLKPGLEITAKDALMMMVALKLSREMNKHKPDNLVDAHGYLDLLEWLEYGSAPGQE